MLRCKCRDPSTCSATSRPRAVSVAASAPAFSAASALTMACSVLPTHCHKSSPDCSLSSRSSATSVAASVDLAGLQANPDLHEVGMSPCCRHSAETPGRHSAGPSRPTPRRRGRGPRHRVRQCQVLVRRRDRVDVHPPRGVQHLRIGGGTVGQRPQQVFAGGGEVAFQPDDRTQRSMLLPGNSRADLW